MIVLTVNTGSTSVKLGDFEVAGQGGEAGPPPRRLQAQHLTGAGLDPAASLRMFLARLPTPPTAVTHRVVHGGTRFSGPALIDDTARQAIAALSELAPLHNPVAIRWIDAAREVCGAGVMHVAAFDTAFFSGLPRVAAEYALPPDLGVELGVRRYGFHGLAHEAMWRRWCELEPNLVRGGRLITLQLGGGCSVTALDQGQPCDTSMGFSPLEGLVMATRSGDIDAAIVPYLERRLGVSGERVVELLNERAGLGGVAGSPADPQALLDEGSESARFAVELYCYRARKYLGAYLAVLGGCDGIVFGGGVGEHVPEVRARILGGLDWAGIELDPAANRATGGSEAPIHGTRSRVIVRVIPVDEELLMVRAALTVAKLAAD
ncbi:MAG: acetate/propionate family kinase [Gammaproteobacteria bacterium]|nr:acetate/propionate family kinase [Gammaproteobacteria bacterium]